MSGMISKEAAEYIRKEEQMERDRLDGAALRRLREALMVPEGSWRYCPDIIIRWDDENAYEPGGFTVMIGEGGDTGIGATIAEAADKAREALG